jgi:hypothetical protein
MISAAMAAVSQWGCNEAGLIGYVLSWAALGVGPGLWVGYVAIGRHHGELYLVLGGLTALVTVAIQYMLTALYHPLPSLATVQCGGDYTGLMPNASVALLFHFLVLARAHDLHLGTRTAWLTTIARMVLLAVGVPAIAVWTHRSTVLNCVWGALLGTVCGCVLSVVLIFGLTPRLEYANGWWFSLCNMAHQPEFLARYAAEHPDHPKAINYSWAYLTATRRRCASGSPIARCVVAPLFIARAAGRRPTHTMMLFRTDRTREALWRTLSSSMRRRSSAARCSRRGRCRWG